MKHVGNYKMFLENYEEIMKDMADDVDLSKIEGAESEIEKLRTNIEAKKEELEKNLENLEKLEVDTFTEDNQDLLAKKQIEIKESIEKLKEEISSFEENIKTLKDNIQSFKAK